MASPEDTGLRQRYGPWALVIGASEGIGAAFARMVADQGLNVILVARRQHALDEVAASIKEACGVEARTLAIDLTSPDAVATIVDATSDVEVGLLLYAAGADPNFTPFLSQPIGDAVALVQRNCLTPLRLSHHFAQPMQERQRGGIVLVSSGAGLVGGPNMVAYGASKAFDMVMAEGLWAELHGRGVDVLGLVIGVTDTPALGRLLLRRGQLADAEIPGAATPEQVAAEALANLTEGPTYFGTDDVRAGVEHLGSMTRNDAVRMVAELQGGVMGAGERAAS